MKLAPERTIMRKRPCKHCGREIYLQHIPVTPKLNWICFDTKDGRLHDCAPRLLAPQTRELVTKAIERMNHHNNNSSKLVHDIDRIIQRLRDIRQDVINSHKQY